MEPREEVSIDITVPSCSCCAAKMEQEVSAVLAVPRGTMRFFVPIRAQLRYQPRTVELGRIVEVLKEKGCEVHTETAEFRIPSRPALPPAVWKEKIEKLSKKLEGIISSSISFEASRITVDYIPSLISSKEVRESVIGWSAPHPGSRTKDVTADVVPACSGGGPHQGNSQWSS